MSIYDFIGLVGLVIFVVTLFWVLPYVTGNRPRRKVMQVVCHPHTEYSEGIFIVLCSDGTMWEQVYRYDREGGGTPTNHRWEWDEVKGPK